MSARTMSDGNKFESSEAETFVRSETTEGTPTAPNVWMLQFKPGARSEDWLEKAVAGAPQPWRSSRKGVLGRIRAGEPLIYRRTIDGEDRGGIVGTGRIASSEVDEEDGVYWFQTEIEEFFGDAPVPLDRVQEEAMPERGFWQGAILKLSPSEALATHELLLRHDRAPLLNAVEERQLRAMVGEPVRDPGPQPDPGLPPDLEPAPEPDPAPTPLPAPDSELRVKRDDAELDHDALGRAPLAMSLAWTLHNIWCAEQGLAPAPARTPRRDAPGFVAHVDAPWGGGKTSFANLVARTLNPALDAPRYGLDHIPRFLRERFPGRADISGIFIRDALEPGKLRPGGASDYRWDARARRPWIIVPFNAWLNQHVEPPWWSFYQSIRKTCFDAIRREGLPTVHQNDDAAGTYATHYEGWIDRFDRWRGLWLREFWWRFWTPQVRNSAIVLAVVVVTSLILQSLGLFSLEEIKKGWASEGAQSARWSLSTVLLTVLMVLFGGASVLWSLFATLFQSLLPGTPEAARNYSLGSSDPLERFRRHFGAMMEDISRPVLVIVDDIDRCDPKFIVEMTRGLQTILKSPQVVYLLLGDRKWIEKAFEICHEDMKDIDVGSEHSFGGRFVEKAIQLSYVLPELGENQEDYVREVLAGSAVSSTAAGQGGGAVLGSALSEETPLVMEGEPGAPPADASGRERMRLREAFSRSVSITDIDRIAAEEAKRVDGSEGQRFVREETVLRRAAQKEEVERDIRHRLQPLAKFLPGNPRDIKRVINAITMYQDSLSMVENADARVGVGMELWRQLVIGVVLLIGYPKSWSLLARHPGWAGLLTAGIDILPGDAESPEARAFESLSRNSAVMALLAKTELVDEDGEIQITVVTPDVIRALARLIPVV